MARTSYKPFVGKRNATKLLVLMLLEITEAQLGLKGLSFRSIYSAIPNISRNYLAHRLKFWHEINYVSVRPVYERNKYCLHYSLSGEGRRFLKYVPVEVLEQYALDIDTSQLQNVSSEVKTPLNSVSSTPLEAKQEPIQRKQRVPELYVYVELESKGKTFYVNINTWGGFYVLYDRPTGATQFDSVERALERINRLRRQYGLEGLDRSELYRINSD